MKNISNTNILTTATNPKEYLKNYKDFLIDKKHKGLKRNTPGIDFEAHSERLTTLHEYCFESKQKKLNKKDKQFDANEIYL